MKYRYTIIDEWDAVWGTNDPDVAALAYEEDGNLVIDVLAGKVLADNGARDDIDPWQPPGEESDDE